MTTMLRIASGIRCRTASASTALWCVMPVGHLLIMAAWHEHPVDDLSIDSLCSQGLVCEHSW